MNSNEIKSTLVFGASEDPARYSNMAVRLLRSYGHPVHAIGRQAGTIADVEIETGLDGITPDSIDTVTLYLNPKNQSQYYDSIRALHPKRVVFNPGSENPEFQQLLTQDSIPFEEACTLVLLKTNQF